MFLESGGNLGINMENKRSPSAFGPALASFGAADEPYQSDVTLSYTQPLLKNVWGVNGKKSLKIIALNREMSEISLSLKKASLTNEIVKAYWDLSFARKNLQLQKNSLERAKKFHESNLRKFKDGLLEEVDIIATEASIVIREASILLAEDAVKNARDNLAKILNIKEAARYNFAVGYAEEFSHEEVDMGGALKDAAENKHEIKLARKSREMASFDTGIKKNEKLPDLNLTAQCGLNGAGAGWSEDFDEISSAENKTWYVGVNMVFYPFNKKAGSLFNKSGYSENKSEAELDLAKQNVRLLCAAAVRRVNTQSAYVQAAKKAMELQEKKLKLEEIKFNQGRSSSQFVLNYQDDLSGAQTQYYSAASEYHKAMADLKLITGK
jgi:outer membrane protein TolC